MVNWTKLLCTLFDHEKKGYVSALDIVLTIFFASIVIFVLEGMILAFVYQATGNTDLLYCLALGNGIVMGAILAIFIFFFVIVMLSDWHIVECPRKKE